MTDQMAEEEEPQINAEGRRSNRRQDSPQRHRGHRAEEDRKRVFDRIQDELDL
jgi:hypothetical protein